MLLGKRVLLLVWLWGMTYVYMYVRFSFEGLGFSGYSFAAWESDAVGCGV